MGLRLSVLDQSPVPSGFTPADALQNSISLARHVDTLGFTRLWYSEHHAMDLLACTAPEILLARIGAETKRIRIGSGGIMLPHYSPFKVAEVFSTLEALYPGRIDLGIGRAPGGGQLEAHALRRIRTGPLPDDFPQQLAELLAFLHPEQFPPNHPFANLRVSPAPSQNLSSRPDPTPNLSSRRERSAVERPASPAAPPRPDLWLLGSSMWSAVTAAAEGLPYAFAHFFSPIQTRNAIEHYRHAFTPSAYRQTPEATLAIGVICADTQAEADRLHLSVRLLQRRIRMNDRRPVATPEDAARELSALPTPPNPLVPFTAGSFDEPESEFPRYIVGTPGRVRDQLTHIARELELTELIVNTITHSHAARLRSYSLLAEAFNLQ
jgi:luciferase family oxidoreductase group 1